MCQTYNYQNCKKKLTWGAITSCVVLWLTNRHCTSHNELIS